MRILGLALVSFLLPLVGVGQMDDNTVTVVANRTTAIQPDQAQISVYADFESTAGLPDVLAAVQSVGITEANLLSVSTLNQGLLSVSNLNQGPPAATTEWSFVLAVPFSKQGDTLSALAALQQSIGKNPNRSISFSVQGARISPQLQASTTCLYGALFQDATSKAQALASAAGQMVGSVVTVSDGTSVDGSEVGPPTAAFLIGDFAVSPVILDPLGGARLTGVPTFASLVNNQIPASTSQSCTLVVQFKLLH